MEFTNENAAGVLMAFAGGEVEIHNKAESYLLRGAIAEISVDGGCLKIKFDWLASAVDPQGGNSAIPTGGWVEEGNVEYSLQMFVAPDPTIRHDPGFTLVSATKLDDRGVVLTSGVSNELLVFFLPGVSALDQSRVRWLENGPHANYMARVG